MTHKFNLPGVGSGASGADASGSPSTNGEKPKPISDMLGLIAPASPACPDMSKLPQEWESPFQAETRVLLCMADALRLAGLVEWKVIVIGGERPGWALFFPESRWERVGSGELVLRPGALGGLDHA